MPAVGQHAREPASKRFADFQQHFAVSTNTGPVFAAVDLDQRPKISYMGPNTFCDGNIVGDDIEHHPGLHQRRRTPQLLRSDPRGYRDIPKPVTSEILRFRKRRYRDRPCFTTQRKPGYIGRLGSLQMRTQQYTMPAGDNAHRLEISLEDDAVKHKTGSRQIL